MVIFDIPCASRHELLGFARGVVVVVVVLTFGHILLLDLCGLQPSGVIRFCSLNHPTWFRGCIPVFSTFSVDVIVGVSLLFRVSSVVVSRAASRGWSLTGFGFQLLVIVESRIQWVTGVLRELLVVRSHGDGTGCVSGVLVGAVER